MSNAISERESAYFHVARQMINHIKCIVPYTLKRMIKHIKNFSVKS